MPKCTAAKEVINQETGKQRRLRNRIIRARNGRSHRVENRSHWTLRGHVKQKGSSKKLVMSFMGDMSEKERRIDLLQGFQFRGKIGPKRTRSVSA